MEKLETKNDFFKLFKKINEPAWSHLTKGKTRIDYAHNGVGYGNNIAGIEGFARILWGAGPALGSLDGSWKAAMVDGIRHGTNPNHPEFWGLIGERDQRMVEMPAIALALLYEDKWLWRQFDHKAQEHIITWLTQILDHKCADGNWQFFKVIVGTVIEKLGYPTDQSEIAAAFEKIEACYLGAGWYQDSWRGRQDYYNPFAFHYYGLLYSQLCPEDPRSQKFQQRALAFAKDYLHFFSEDGANVPFGRSMIYRFAVSSFWVALIWADLLPEFMGELKGLITRNLQWWLKQDIFDPAGMLTLGYTYPQLTMTEPYNSSLSPYWCNKIFLLLALPEDHPFWKAAAKPLPERKNRQLLKTLNAIVQHDHRHTFFSNAGQPGPNFHTLTNEKYLKFAYSSQFGFSIPRANQLKEEQALDSCLGLQRADTTILTSGKNKQVVATSGQFMVRNNVKNVQLTDKWVASTWQVNPQTWIRTWLIAVEGWQVRVHRLYLDDTYVVYETGFALAMPPYEEAETFEKAGQNGRMNSHGFSGIADLASEKRNNAGVLALPNTNLMTWDQTYIPGLEVTLDKGEHTLATAVYANEDGKWGSQKWQHLPVLKREDEGHLRIDFQQESVLVEL